MSRYLDAVEAATKLVESDISYEVNLPMMPEKVLWETQIIGVYDLIFPYLHIDIPTREEVMNFIQQSFDSHDMSNWHNGIGSRPGSDTIMETPFISMETNGDAGMGTVQVRGNSPINNIGYGL